MWRSFISVLLDPVMQAIGCNAQSCSDITNFGTSVGYLLDRYNFEFTRIALPLMLNTFCLRYF